MPPARARLHLAALTVTALSSCDPPPAAPPRLPPRQHVQFGQEIYPGSPAFSAAQRASSPPAPPPASSPPRLRPSVFRDGPPPSLDRPVLFDTPEADRILGRMRVFPADSPWNEDVSALPIHPDSASIIASIGAQAHLDFNLDMNFVIVPPGQSKVPVEVTEIPHQSDPGPFPVPDEAPIENWPMARNEDVAALPKPGQTLAQIQEVGSGDRHLIIVEPHAGIFHEFWQARRTPRGWQASQASTFDLTTNALRPAGWTSADAAGLPIFPAVVRYDDVTSGMVRHAMRVTVPHTRRAFVYPATHFASRNEDPRLPRMGERLRLKKGFDVSRFPPHARAILEGLKRHGMFVADNGASWRLSIAPDRRFEGLLTLLQVRGSDFEVVIPTGPHEGPRR